MAEIACLGVLVADLLGRPIDSLPEHGRLGLVDRMELHLGGCAANTAVGLAKLGIEASVLGKVGQDGLGDFMVRELERFGLDTRGVVQDPGSSTSASMVLVSSEGERTFLHCTGGNGHYRLEDVDWSVLDDARIVDVAGAHILPALDGQPMAEVLKEAKRRGKITALDTVWDATGRWMETLGPSLGFTDFFLPSLSEAQALTGEQRPRDVAGKLRDAGVGTVVLKLGSAGCYVQSEAGELVVEGFSVEPVDGTGSGDAFVGGFLVGLLKGWEMERTARFANAVGALCVTGLGATGGIRSLEETEAFIREQTLFNPR